MRKSSFLLFTMLAVGSLTMGCQGSCGSNPDLPGGDSGNRFEDKADKSKKPPNNPNEDHALPSPPQQPHPAPERGHPPGHH